MSARDFLVEIGTEELPPKSLFTMAQAFAQEIDQRLTSASLEHGAVEWFATPRRLAVRVRSMHAGRIGQPPLAPDLRSSGALAVAGLQR